MTSLIISGITISVETQQGMTDMQVNKAKALEITQTIGDEIIDIMNSCTDKEFYGRLEDYYRQVHCGCRRNYAAMYQAYELGKGTDVVPADMNDRLVAIVTENDSTLPLFVMARAFAHGYYSLE